MIRCAHQGQETFRYFTRKVKSLAKRVPDINERHLAQIFWDGVEKYIRVKFLDRGMNPDDTSLKSLIKWAVRFETAREAAYNLDPSFTDERNEDQEPEKVEAKVGAARYEHYDSSDSEELCLSARGSHRSQTRYQSTTSPEFEDEERHRGGSEQEYSAGSEIRASVRVAARPRCRRYLYRSSADGGATVKAAA
jgi:hypothetical protein